MRLTKATFACTAIYNARELEKASQKQGTKKPAISGEALSFS